MNNCWTLNKSTVSLSTCFLEPVALGDSLVQSDCLGRVWVKNAKWDVNEIGRHKLGCLKSLLGFNILNRKALN